MGGRKLGENTGIAGWSNCIQSIMDEMLHRNFVHFRDDGAWQPATNVYERPDVYFLCVDLAGLDEKRIDVQCPASTRITISGRRPQPRPVGVEGPLSVHVMEIDEGPFRRIIDLPAEIVVDEVEASYHKGFLWVVLPKALPR